jgi:hypothetical protein
MILLNCHRVLEDEESARELDIYAQGYLISLGGVLHSPDPVYSCAFNNIVVFDEGHPGLLFRYLPNLIRRTHVERYGFAEMAYDLLSEESYFGGKVTVLCHDFHRQFISASWDRGRPFGHELHVQCQNCYRLSSLQWVPTHYFGCSVWCQECDWHDHLEPEEDIFFPPGVIWEGKDGWVIKAYSRDATKPITHLPDHPTFIGIGDMRRALRGPIDEDEYEVNEMLGGDGDSAS